MAAHPIPAAIDGLIALWAGHSDLAYTVAGRTVPLLVIDGPPISDYDDLRVLAVGVGSQTLAGANGSLQGAPASVGSTGFGGGGRRTTRHEVACQLGVWSGDTDTASVRAAAFEVLETLGRILTGNRTLSGAVDWARIVRDAYQPAQTPDGAGTAIDFTVQVEATRFVGA